MHLIIALRLLAKYPFSCLQVSGSSSVKRDNIGTCLVGGGEN